MNDQSSVRDPILCAHLLRRVDEKLLDLLRSLEPSEWDLQTIAPLWKVRDVAAHLLDTALRKLSMVRDSCSVETVHIRSPQDVITLVNRLNAEGVTVYRRLSPPVLIEMMKMACEQIARFHESLEPLAGRVLGGWSPARGLTLASPATDCEPSLARAAVHDNPDLAKSPVPADRRTTLCT